MDSDGSEKGPGTEFCESANEKSGFNKLWEFVADMRKYQDLKNSWV